MVNLIRLIVVVVIAVVILSFCSLNRRVELAINTDSPLPYTAGQVIKIKYLIRNTGSRGISGSATVSSDKTAINNCPGLNAIGDLDNSLEPNNSSEVIECTADYSVTAADVQAGAVQITASASVGGVVSNPVTVNIPTGPASPLRVTPTANPSTYGQAGQQITFTYVIQNTGTSNLGPDQFRITDSLIRAAPFECGPANTTLAPSATVTCTAPYTITQNDMSAVSITNIAIASGGGASPSPSASTTINRNSNTLTLKTNASPSTYGQAGQQITFNYVITNTHTGNLGPSQFTVKDNLIRAEPFN